MFTAITLAFAPSNTSLETLVWVAGQRWRIEECFQFGKSHLGLADYEVRSWTGWHRHTALVLAAGAFLSVLRFQLEGFPEISHNPLFLMTRKAGSLDALSFRCVDSYPSQFSRIKTMDLENTVSSFLVD